MAKSREVFALIITVFDAFPQFEGLGKLTCQRSDEFLAGLWAEGNSIPGDANVV